MTLSYRRGIRLAGPLPQADCGDLPLRASGMRPSGEASRASSAVTGDVNGGRPRSRAAVRCARRCNGRLKHSCRSPRTPRPPSPPQPRTATSRARPGSPAASDRGHAAALLPDRPRGGRPDVLGRRVHALAQVVLPLGETRGGRGHHEGAMKHLILIAASASGCDLYFGSSADEDPDHRPARLDDRATIGAEIAKERPDRGSPAARPTRAPPIARSAPDEGQRRLPRSP